MNGKRLTLLLLALTAHASPAQANDGSPVLAAMGALDFIFIGIACYVVWRIFTNIARKKRDEDDNTYDATPNRDDDGDDDPNTLRSRRAQAAWEYLTGGLGQAPRQEEQHEMDAPGTFNEREFLSGAKLIYGRIRQSFAARDLADLRQFAAPDMMRRFEAMAAARPEREQVSVLLVEARVIDLKRDGKRTEVQVAYDATISDDPQAGAPRKTAEVWTFSREETVADSKWLLESMDAKQ